MAGSVQIAGLIEMAGLAEAAPILPVGKEPLAILPALILSLTGVAVLALDLILDRTRRRRAEPDARTPAMIGGGFAADPLLFTSLLGLASAAAFLGTATVPGASRPRGAALTDGLAAGSGILILLLIAAGLLAVTGQEKRHDRGERRRGGEFFCLVLLASAFLVLCVQSIGPASVFVSVEALSLIVFALASLEAEGKAARPGFLRTFIVSESASAGFLLGLAILAAGGHDATLLALATTLIVTALVVKTLALPFSILSRAESASLVVVQMSRCVQIAIAVLLVREGRSLSALLETGLVAGFLSVAAAALLVFGVWLGVRRGGRAPHPPAEEAYHLGFLLTAVVVEIAGALTSASTMPAGVPLLFYLFVVEAPRLGVAIWTAGSESRGSRTSGSRATMSFAVLLLSLGGVPPLPGFWARLILFREAITADFGYLALVAAATSVAGLYYHVSLAVVVLRRRREEVATASAEGPGLIEPAMVTAIAAACLVVGLFPETLLELCRTWGTAR